MPTKKQAASTKAPAPKKKAAPAATTTSAKKATGQKAATKKPTTKAVTKQAPTTQPAAKKTAAKKTTAKKTTATKAAASKAAAAPASRKKAAPAKKAPLTKSPFDAKFLEEQRRLLEAERASYTRQSEALLAEAESLMRDREPGDVQFDEESGEGDTLAVERERDLALSAQARAAVEEIDAALERIANGTYGICRVSGLAIPKERLRAIPWATERVEYKVGGFARR